MQCCEAMMARRRMRTIRKLRTGKLRTRIRSQKLLRWQQHLQNVRMWKSMAKKNLLRRMLKPKALIRCLTAESKRC